MDITKKVTINPHEEKKEVVSIQVIVDIILILICGGIIPVIFGYIKATKQGFFCDDENIMYPAKPGPETITNGMLWSFCVLVPIGIICLTEVANKKLKVDEDEETVAEEKEVYFFRWNVPYVVQQIYKFGIVYLLGLLMSELSNDFIKTLIGRPRPNFLDLCKPDFNCSSVKNQHYYVAEYKCTNPNLWSENYIRVSFPSGHTTLTTYAMFFVVFYLHKRITFTRYSLLAKPVLLWMLLMPAGYISLTRIIDHMHHWDDIVGGFFIGFLICVVLIFSQTDLYKKN